MMLDNFQMNEFDDLPNFSLDNYRQCAVCKKAAGGIHYNVYCCHGCKSFFRRAITDKLEFQPCIWNETCYADDKIDEESKKCKFCRIQKCFMVGMTPQFTTKRKYLDDENTDQKPYNIMKHFETQVRIRNPYSIVKILVTNLAHVDEKIEKLKKSTYNPIIFPNFKEMIEAPSKLHLADKLGMMTGWPFTQSEYLEKHSALIDMKIKLEINDQVNYPSFTEFEGINIKDWFPFELMLTLEHAKTFDFFNRLDIKDKLVLIRGTSVMVQTLSSTYFSYKSKWEYIVKPDGACVAGSSKHLVINSLISSYEKTMDNQKKWRNGQRILSLMIRDKLTFSEFLLLRAIVLCNPALDLSVEAQDILQKEREKISQALFNHCLMEHGKNGPVRFTVLLNYITILSDHLGDFRDFLIVSQIISPGKTPQSRKKLINDFLSIEMR